MHPIQIARRGALSLLLLAACSDDDVTTTDDTTQTSETSDTTSEVGDTERETEATVSLCDPERAPVTPVGLDDVTYATVVRTECMGEPCLCAEAAGDRVEKLLACDAVAVGWYEGLGSLYMRVVGRDDGDCVIDVATEIEGGVGVNRCRLPLPMTPWPGLEGVLVDGTTDPLDGIEDRCERVDSCCLLDGCPDPCEATVPLCPVGRVDYCEP